MIPKARVAPIRDLTILKMELTAVFMAALLLDFIVKVCSLEVNVDKCVFWSDSQTVLHWLHTGDAGIPVYVPNRVDEIRLPS